MLSSISVMSVRRTAVAIAVGMTCLAVQAETSPVNFSVSEGLGKFDGSNASRALLGQYSGQRDRSVVGVLDVDYSLRDPEAGKWVDFSATDLFGDARGFGFTWKQPGDWKFNANYNELVRHEPLIINSGLSQADTTTPQVRKVTVGQGNDLELSTKRKGLGMGFNKILSPEWQFQVDLKTEEKEGARLSGAIINNTDCVGVACMGITPVLMLPEPISSRHSQIDARVSYGIDKLRLSAGYYGSFFTNDNEVLRPGPANVIASNFVMALPPDNQAHQFDVTGSYDVSPSTRANFKLAWTTATQNADFPNGLTGPLLDTNATNIRNIQSLLVTSPGARVDTTMAKLGFTSRLTPKLSLLGDVRYEDKDDQTNLFYYNQKNVIDPLNPANVQTVKSTNHQLPNKKVQGKLQASWQFDPMYQGILAADYESIDRGTYTATSLAQGISALRQDTDETTWRAEVRGRLNEDLSGTVGLSSSKREGSNWLQPNTATTGVVEVAQPANILAAAPGAVFMTTLADRQRDKVRLSADWQANEKLGLQFSYEDGTDKYNSPSANGLHESKMNQVNVDWTYAVSANWSLNGYLSQAKQKLNQSVYEGSTMAFDNTNLSASIGMKGKVNNALQVGASLIYMDDKSVFGQSANASTTPAAAALLAQSGGLPDISYRQTVLKLFAQYALDKQSAVRVDYLRQELSVNDWTWKSLVYADGTSVKSNDKQNVNYLGVTYEYKFQ